MPSAKLLHIHPEIRRRAQEFRKPLTPAENRVWQILRNRQLGGFKFRRQFPIGPYIADFCCAEVRLIIEIDGPSHASAVDYDDERTAWLEAQGYKIIRFHNLDVMQRLDDVAKEIGTTCIEEKT